LTKAKKGAKQMVIGGKRSAKEHKRPERGTKKSRKTCSVHLGKKKQPTSLSSKKRNSGWFKACRGGWVGGHRKGRAERGSKRGQVANRKSTGVKWRKRRIPGDPCWEDGLKEKTREGEKLKGGDKL